MFLVLFSNQHFFSTTASNKLSPRRMRLEFSMSFFVARLIVHMQKREFYIKKLIRSVNKASGCFYMRLFLFVFLTNIYFIFCTNVNCRSADRQKRLPT